MSVFKPWCFALLCAVMLAPACAKKSDSYYPKSWVVPVEGSKNMFTGTKVEAEAKKSPLKTK